MAAVPFKGEIKMSAPYHTGNTLRPETEPYKGVGGWLMVFIILILFLIPLLTLFNALTSFAFAASVSRYFPLIMFLTLVDILCSALVTCFGMVTGILLWTQNSRAAGLARIYLFTRAFYAVFLLFVVGLSMDTSDMPVIIQRE